MDGVPVEVEKDDAGGARKGRRAEYAEFEPGEIFVKAALPAVGEGGLLAVS